MMSWRPSAPSRVSPGSSNRRLTGGVQVCLSILLSSVALGVPEATLVVRGGQRFDTTTGTFRSFGSIVVEGDRIVRVTEPGDTTPLPAGARELDARGRFVIPGLIDAHVHLVHILKSLQLTAEDVFPLFLRQGVTTLRDVGDERSEQKRVARFAEDHPTLAPRVVLGSPLIDGNPPYHPFVSVPLTQVEAVPAWVDAGVDDGVRTFKLYVGTTREIGQAVIAAAHRRGAWVTAHLAWGYRPLEAIEDGIDSLEHMGALFDFLLPPDAPRWPPPAERRGVPAEELAALQRRILEAKSRVDFSGEATTTLIEALVRRRVRVDPTLVVYRNWMLLRDQPEVLDHPDLASVPERLLEGWRRSARALPLDPTTVALRQREFLRLQELTVLLHRSGVELLLGTDTPVQFCPPGLALHQEMELWVQAGIPPAAVLQAATRNNARSLGQADRLGALEPGMTADLVVLDADPLLDIRAARRIAVVVRSGQVCTPATPEPTGRQP